MEKKFLALKEYNILSKLNNFLDDEDNDVKTQAMNVIQYIEKLF
jgi:hypothetical protein